MPRTLLVSAVACLALTACGSTVQVKGTALAGSAGDGLSAPVATGPTGSSSSPAAPGTQTGTQAPTGSGGVTATVPGGTASTAGTGARAVGKTAAAAPVVPSFNPNLPAKGKAVEVGIVYVPDAADFGKLLGGKSANIGDQQTEAKAAVAWVNAHGGLGGHVITPVFVAVNATSTKAYSEEAQEICAAFTQDHHVVAAMAVGINIPNDLPACLSKNKVLYVSGAHYMHDLTDLQQYPYLVAPWEADVARVGRSVADLVVSKGLATSGDKVGVLYMQEPSGKRASDALGSQLGKHGISLVSVAIPAPQSTPDIANATSAVQSAELTMASQGVKAVTFLCPGCMTYFLQDAQSQRYYPRYVFTSLDTPGGIAANAKPQQISNAIGLGWTPMQDVGTYTHPSAFTGNSTRETCRAIEKAAGQIADDTSEYAAQTFCDGILFLRAAGLAASGVSGESLLAGVNRLGTSHPSASTFTSSLGPDRHAGAAAYRTMHYDATTKTMVYDTKALTEFS